MLPEELKGVAAAAALEEWDASAITGGSLNLGQAVLHVRPDAILSVCRKLRDEMGFAQLCGLSAIDRYPMEPRFEIVYLLLSYERNERVTLKAALPGAAPEIASVTEIWAGADWYERETFDLFGVRFQGHPNLKRLMMPEEWEGHPLRKDFPIHGHKYSYQNE
jgi:NADH-quinone oxidoreductase subunit C